jgi:hypothetical protein
MTWQWKRPKEYEYFWTVTTFAGFQVLCFVYLQLYAKVGEKSAVLSFESHTEVDSARRQVCDTGETASDDMFFLYMEFSKQDGNTS